MANSITFSTGSSDTGSSAVCTFDTINTTLEVAPFSTNLVHRVVALSFQATEPGVMRVYSNNTVIFTRTFFAGSFDFAVPKNCPLIQTKPGETLGIQFSVPENEVVVGFYSL